MAQGISFSGLGSGLDTDSIISQLTDIERRPLRLLERRQTELSGQKAIINQINTGMLSLRSSAEKLAEDDLFSIVNASSNESTRVGVSATNEAAAGTFSVEVVALAQARSLSSRSFSTTSDALGLSGEFVLNGKGIELEAEQSLSQIRDVINDSDLDVSAQIFSIASGDNRLILTATEVGSEGFDIKDASSSDALQSLGFTSSDVLVKDAFASGARSATFLEDTGAIGTLLGLATPPSGTVTIGDQQIDVDLAADSLNDIRDRINAAAPTGVAASVVSGDEGGLTRYHLEIEGTTDIVDNSGAMEALGVLDSGGGIVDGIVTGAEGDRFSSTTTSVGSLLGLGSAPTGSVLIEGQAVDLNLAADSLSDVQTRINDAGIAGVTATITSATDEEGNSEFRLRIDGASDFTDAGNVLESLGIIVGSNSAFESVSRVLTANATNQEQGAILNPVGSGAKSAEVDSDGDPAGPLLGSTAAGTVTIGDAQVSIDLNTDSLNDIRDKINAAGATGVTAAVNIAGVASFELEISGTTDFDDPDGVLVGLGVLGAVSTQDADTRLGDILGAGVQSGDTITISGVDHAGDQVSGSFSITSTNLKVQSLLSGIEGVFGNEVTASLDASGRIVLTDDQAGTSSLELSLTANNEGGGSLSFGVLSATTQGAQARSSQLQAGQDAEFRINGIALTRSSNTVTDAVEGITLDLKQAEEGEFVEISVTRDDTTELRQQIGSFVADYNSALGLINEQFTYNKETETAGPLAGDSTLLALQSQLRNAVTGQIDGLTEGFNALVLIGVNFDRQGQLVIDDEKLTEALTENLTEVRELFTAQGKTTDSGVDFVRTINKTASGTYSVNITAAAERAQILGTLEMIGGLDQDQTLTIAEIGGEGKSATIELLTGDTLSEIVTKINGITSSEVADVRRASVANTVDGASAVSSATALGAIFGAGVVDGDTIRIQGTTHDGDSAVSTFTIDDAGTKTIGDLLDAVRSTFGSEISASIDEQGRVVVSDNQVGPSQLRVVLVEGNEGGGTLDLGSLEVVESEGRYPMEVTASNKDGRLFIQHDSYGAGNGFTISQSRDQLGLTSGTFSGADVEGTINGEAAEGFGRILTGEQDNDNTEGLVLRVTTSAEELAESGSDRGSVSLIYGVGRRLTNALDFITDTIDGTLVNRTKAIDNTIDNMDDQIASMERRVEQKRLNLVNKFAALEGTLATLQSQGDFLTQQLAGLAS